MPEALGDLATLVGASLVGVGDLLVTDVTHDSRTVVAGSLFVAIAGSTADGHAFVRDLPQGSAACVTTPQATSIPQLVVSDTRAVLGDLAHAVHGRPSEHLAVVGITGTNGKTSATYLLASILRADGRTPACIGTTGVVVGQERKPLPRTTPEASDLHRLLGELLANGVDSVALEVSSHALTLHRVAGVRFAAVGFTNLSHDHLDFHTDLDAYFEAKARLFELSDRRVANVADPYGRRLADRHDAVRVGEDVTASEIELRIDSASFDLTIGSSSHRVELPIGGRFMVENSLVAAGLAAELGVDPATIAKGLSSAGSVPGRFEAVAAGQDFAVVVDFAHGPESIASVVASAKALTPGRVVAVVGAGGDRDREKRVPMGRAAAAADIVILTSDNPRSEDPLGIIDQLAAGAADGVAQVRIEPDRRTAITEALASATGGDTVLILGKGHETTQEAGGRTIPFDDREVARQILEELLR